jgi:S-ribosylhomocysteine lyase LuxS involved in autoinducer biosynthesis
MTEIEVNHDTYSPDSITNYDQCIALKHPEKQAIKKEEIERTGELLAHSVRKGRRAYRNTWTRTKNISLG